MSLRAVSTLSLKGKTSEKNQVCSKENRANAKYRMYFRAGLQIFRNLMTAPLRDSFPAYTRLIYYSRSVQLLDFSLFCDLIAFYIIGSGFRADFFVFSHVRSHHSLKIIFHT